MASCAPRTISGRPLQCCGWPLPRPRSPPWRRPSSSGATAAASPATADTAAPQKKSWADVDVDNYGSLSKNEASTVPALSKVFEQADADADGALTADEYKSYVAKAQGGSGNSGGKR